MTHSDPTSTSAGPEGSGARRRLSRGGVVAGMLVVGGVLAALDQITKNWAEATLQELVPQPFLGEVVQLTLLYNSGAAWGMGSGITPVVTLLQMTIVIGVIVYAVRAVRSPWYTLALGLILGGALGNIHDRLLRPPGLFHGEVVDFLELPHWPVFNVADMAVVGGAILIVVLGLIGHPADPAATEASASADEGTPSSADPAAPGDDAGTPVEDAARPGDDLEAPDDPETPGDVR